MRKKLKNKKNKKKKRENDYFSLRFFFFFFKSSSLIEFSVKTISFLTQLYITTHLMESMLTSLDVVTTLTTNTNFND